MGMPVVSWLLYQIHLPFWMYIWAFCAFLHVVFTVYGYRWFLRLFAIKSHEHQSIPPEIKQFPKVCVVICAHDESAIIQRRIRNIRAQTYPAELIQLIIVCDGCSDNTALIARYEGATVIEIPTHSGKSHCLNVAMSHASDAPIVVFTDARPVFLPDAVMQLVRALHAPNVAAVSGVLKLPSMSRCALGTYWDADTEIRLLHSHIGTTTGLCGPICAMRRKYWHPIPNGVVLDDVWMGMVAAAQKGRVAVCSAATAIDDRPYNQIAEWKRKVRTSAGNWQLVFMPRFWAILAASRCFCPWACHKLSRLMLPLDIAVMLVAVCSHSHALFALLAVLLLMVLLGKRNFLCQLAALASAPFWAMILVVFGRIDGRWNSHPSRAKI